LSGMGVRLARNAHIDSLSAGIPLLLGQESKGTGHLGDYPASPRVLLVVTKEAGRLFQGKPATDSDGGRKSGRLQSGMGGRLGPEWVAAFERNGWPASSGMGGRLGSEYAHRAAADQWRGRTLLQDPQRAGHPWPHPPHGGRAARRRRGLRRPLQRAVAPREERLHQPISSRSSALARKDTRRCRSRAETAVEKLAQAQFDGHIPPDLVRAVGAVQVVCPRLLRAARVVVLPIQSRRVEQQILHLASSRRGSQPCWVVRKSNGAAPTHAAVSRGSETRLHAPQSPQQPP